jgi:hypothetical protein
MILLLSAVKKYQYFSQIVFITEKRLSHTLKSKSNKSVKAVSKIRFSQVSVFQSANKSLTIKLIDLFI